jgi:hypothetical protein
MGLGPPRVGRGEGGFSAISRRDNPGVSLSRCIYLFDFRMMYFPTRP